MKKLVWMMSILFVTISFNSCSDDDDDEVVVRDKIIGEWQWDQEFEDGVENTLSACDKKSTIEFFQTGTFTARDFIEDENDVCVALEPVNGTWKNLGNSMYELGDLEIVPDVSINLEVKITFPNNKMIVEYTYTDEDDVTYDLKEIYIKI